MAKEFEPQFLRKTVQTKGVISGCQRYSKLMKSFVFCVVVEGISLNGQNGPPIYLLRGYLRTSDLTIYVNFSTDKKGYICEHMHYPG